MTTDPIFWLLLGATWLFIFLSFFAPVSRVGKMSLSVVAMTLGAVNMIHVLLPLVSQ